MRVVDPGDLHTGEAVVGGVGDREGDGRGFPRVVLLGGEERVVGELKGATGGGARDGVAGWRLEDGVVVKMVLLL